MTDGFTWEVFDDTLTLRFKNVTVGNADNILGLGKDNFPWYLDDDGWTQIAARPVQVMVAAGDGTLIGIAAATSGVAAPSDTIVPPPPLPEGSVISYDWDADVWNPLSTTTLMHYIAVGSEETIWGLDVQNSYPYEWTTGGWIQRGTFACWSVACATDGTVLVVDKNHQIQTYAYVTQTWQPFSSQPPPQDNWLPQYVHLGGNASQIVITDDQGHTLLWSAESQTWLTNMTQVIDATDIGDDGTVLAVDGAGLLYDPVLLSAPTPKFAVTATASNVNNAPFMIGVSHGWGDGIQNWVAPKLPKEYQNRLGLDMTQTGNATSILKALQQNTFNTIHMAYEPTTNEKAPDHTVPYDIVQLASAQEMGVLVDVQKYTQTYVRHKETDPPLNPVDDPTSTASKLQRVEAALIQEETDLKVSHVIRGLQLYGEVENTSLAKAAETISEKAALTYPTIAFLDKDQADLCRRFKQTTLVGQHYGHKRNWEQGLKNSGKELRDLAWWKRRGWVIIPWTDEFVSKDASQQQLLQDLVFAALAAGARGLLWVLDDGNAAPLFKSQGTALALNDRYAYMTPIHTAIAQSGIINNQDFCNAYWCSSVTPYETLTNLRKPDPNYKPQGGDSKQNLYSQLLFCWPNPTVSTTPYFAGISQSTGDPRTFYLLLLNRYEKALTASPVFAGNVDSKTIASLTPNVTVSPTQVKEKWQVQVTLQPNQIVLLTYKKKS